MLEDCCSHCFIALVLCYDHEIVKFIGLVLIKVANNVVHGVCGQPYLSFKIFRLQMEPGVVSPRSGKKRKCQPNRPTIPNQK